MNGEVAAVETWGPMSSQVGAKTTRIGMSDPNYGD